MLSIVFKKKPFLWGAFCSRNRFFLIYFWFLVSFTKIIAFRWPHVFDCFSAVSDHLIFTEEILFTDNILFGAKVMNLVRIRSLGVWVLEYLLSFFFRFENSFIKENSKNSKWLVYANHIDLVNHLNTDFYSWPWFKDKYLGVETCANSSEGTDVRENRATS